MPGRFPGFASKCVGASWMGVRADHSLVHKLADWNMRRVDTALRKPADVAVNSLPHVLSTAKMPNGEPLPKSWIAAELLDNIHAAQSTVALALNHVLWNLANCLEWQSQIREGFFALPLQVDGLPYIQFSSVCGDLRCLHH